MSTTLSRVTLDTLDNCGRAATQVLSAYRLGSHRMAAAVQGAIDKSVVPGVEKFVPAAAERMNEMRTQVFAFVGKGIDQVAERGEQVIGKGRELAATQVHKVAELAAGVTKPAALVEGLRTVARLSLPGAQMALTVSGKVAEGVGALAGVVAGEKPAVRTVKRAAATVKRSVRKTTKPVLAMPKTVARRAPATAKRARKAAVI